LWYQSKFQEAFRKNYSDILDVIKHQIYIFDLQVHSEALSPQTYLEDMQDEESVENGNGHLSEAPTEESFEGIAKLPGQVCQM